jgi:hypothetical protein
MDLPDITEVNDLSVPPRTVEALSRVPESLELMLLPYRLSLPDLREYGEDTHGLLRFFEEIAGPYAQLINKAFPTGALQRHELRAETIAVVTPHVGELLRHLVRRPLSFMHHPISNISSRVSRIS